MQATEEKKPFTVQEAADTLGIPTHRIYKAIYDQKIETVKDGQGYYLISQEALEAYQSNKSSRRTRTFNPEVNVQTQKENNVVSLPQKEVKRQNDATVLQNVVSAVFHFLAQNNLQMNMQSLQEVSAQLRLWEIETPDTPLRVIADGEAVTVISDDYQKGLEGQLQQARTELQEANRKLLYLRTKPQMKTLTDYAQPLEVYIEMCEDGVTIRSPQFPFSSKGKTEEEALAAFRRILWGYTNWLQVHKEKLSEDLQKQFFTLKYLLVEE